MRFFKTIIAWIFQTYSCYLYESILIKRNEADFMPSIRNITFKLIKEKQNLEELASAGFDLSRIVKEFRSILEKGAVAGLLFVEKELASLEWAAMNRQGNRAINIYPLKIDFSQNEAYASGVWTNPKFRRKGLHTYVYYKVYDFLRENGVTIVRSIVATDNLAAQKAHKRFAPQEKIYAKARYMKIMGFQFWSEEPFSNQSSSEMFDKVPSLPLETKNKGAYNIINKEQNSL